MHKIFARRGPNGAGERVFSLQHRAALLCGSLCLLISLTLTLLAALSARYILDQQVRQHGNATAQQIATQVAPVLATGDLIMLEVSLEKLLQEHSLLNLAVTDVESRPLGQAGQKNAVRGADYVAAVTIDGNLAGELRMSMPPATSMAELQTMSLGLVALSLLLSIFAAILGANWGQKIAARIEAVNRELSVVQESADDVAPVDELGALEHAVAALPLDLLKPPASASTSTADYRDAGLLFIHLDSLGRHVETLDESSLLAYTELHRHLIQSAADLYGGQLAVIRQFGILVSFGNGHNSGSPAFRASSCAWLIRHTADQLGENRPLRIKLSLACGLSETGTGTSHDIYPDLYNQYLVDELAGLVDAEGDAIKISPAVRRDPELQNRCLFSDDDSELAGFTEPYCDLLERQQELVLRELQQSRG